MKLLRVVLVLALVLLTACSVRDAERLAIMLTAMVDGLWLELSLDAASFGAEAAVAMVERAVAALLPA